MSGIVVIIYLAIIVAIIVGWWQIFTKAGEAGWKAIIPIVSFVIWIIVALDLAKSFGRGTGFGIGLALLSPIFAPILGFGSDAYKGPAGPVG